MCTIQHTKIIATIAATMGTIILFRAGSRIFLIGRNSLMYCCELMSVIANHRG